MKVTFLTNEDSDRIEGKIQSVSREYETTDNYEYSVIVITNADGTKTTIPIDADIITDDEIDEICTFELPTASDNSVISSLKFLDYATGKIYEVKISNGTWQITQI